MSEISIRKLKMTDKTFFTRWWRNKDLIKLTSGNLKKITDTEIDQYFNSMFKSNDHHFIIEVDKQPIGHISLSKRKKGWFETQIVIGEKKYWNKGYGTKAIQKIIKKAHRIGILKIYLEVRSTNHRAIKAYEKCGFVKIRTIKYPNNIYLRETIRMEYRDK